MRSGVGYTRATRSDRIETHRCSPAYQDPDRRGRVGYTRATRSDRIKPDSDAFFFAHRVTNVLSVSQPFRGRGRALADFFKTRILLVGFGYNETNLESFTKLTARSRAGSGRFRGNEALSDHAPFRRFARLISIFGYMAIFEHHLSCVGRS